MPDSFDRLVIHVDGSPTAQQIETIADENFPNLRHISRGRRPPDWLPGYDGVNQLFALALVESSKGISE